MQTVDTLFPSGPEIWLKEVHQFRCEQSSSPKHLFLRVFDDVVCRSPAMSLKHLVAV